MRLTLPGSKEIRLSQSHAVPQVITGLRIILLHVDARLTTATAQTLTQNPMIFGAVSPAIPLLLKRKTGLMRHFCAVAVLLSPSFLAHLQLKNKKTLKYPPESSLIDLVTRRKEDLKIQPANLSSKYLLLN